MTLYLLAILICLVLEGYAYCFHKPRMASFMLYCALFLFALTCLMGLTGHLPS